MNEFYSWSEEDLNDLDAKFDALVEYLGIEFVFERVSDGSTTADSSRCYVRPKHISGVQNIAAQHIAQPVPEVSLAKEPEPEVCAEEPMPEPEMPLETPMDYTSKPKKYKKGYPGY